MAILLAIPPLFLRATPKNPTKRPFSPFPQITSSGVRNVSRFLCILFSIA